MIKFLDYIDLQAQLLKKASRKIFPLKAMFELTYRCNLKCRHCYVVPNIIAANREELDTNQAFNILDQLAKAGCLNIGFTGGEPFLRNDIFDILGYAKNKGFNVIVLTNGTLITPEKAEKLKELGLNKIDVSFHTTKEDGFDWFTQAPGTYQKVLRSVRLLRERGVEVYLKSTAMTINKDDMVNIRHLAVERFGAHFRWVPGVTPAWNGGKENLEFRLKPHEILKVKKDIQKDTEIEFEKLDTLNKENRRPKKSKRKRRQIKYEQLFRCGAGKTEAVIDPYGNMRPCMDISYPRFDILKSGFNDCWRKIVEYVKSTKAGPGYKCRDCGLVQYCVFCPARGWLECGDMSACPPFLREMAEVAKNEDETHGG